MSEEEIEEKLATISEYLDQYKKDQPLDQLPPLTPLLELTKDQSPRVRWRAIEAIGLVADPDKIVDTLIAALQDPHNMVRWNATLALGELGDPRAIFPLLDTLDDDNPNVKKMANWALVELGENAVHVLIEALEHQDWWIREEVARLLGQIGDEQAREPLLRALNDPRERVREKAAEALGQIRDPQTINGLITALYDEYGDTRENAMIALVKMGAEAVEPLFEVLKQPNKMVRTIVSQILGDIGDPRAIEPLTQIKRGDPDFKVRRSAAKALKKIKQIRI